MRFLRWIAAVLVGLFMVSALATFGVSLNTRLTVFNRDTWKQTLTQLYDFQRLNSVIQEIGPELAAEMRDEQPGELHEIQTAFTQEAFAVAQVLQPSVEQYVSNAVDGVWDYLTGEADVIDLGPVSYAEVLESSLEELHGQVRAARESDGAPASETVALLSQLPADEFDDVLAEVADLYRSGFVFVEPIAQGYGEQVYQPTAGDEAFRREFHELVSTVHTAIAVSAAVALVCIIAFIVLGRKTKSRRRLIGNALLWYSIPSALLLIAISSFSHLVARAFQRMATTEIAGQQAGDQAANTMRVILAEYGDLWIPFFVPLMVFVGIAFASGVLLRILARRSRPATST